MSLMKQLCIGGARGEERPDLLHDIIATDTYIEMQRLETESRSSCVPSLFNSLEILGK